MELARRFIDEDAGAETVEYALVLGLVAIAAVAAIGLVGTNISAWWNGLATKVGTIAS